MESEIQPDIQFENILKQLQLKLQPKSINISQLIKSKQPKYILLQQDYKNDQQINITNSSEFTLFSQQTSKINLLILQFCNSNLNIKRLLRFRRINKNSKTSIDSYILTTYMQVFKSFPQQHATIPVMIRNLILFQNLNKQPHSQQSQQQNNKDAFTYISTSQQANPNKSITLLNTLLKIGITNNDRVLIKSSLKQFVKYLRTSRAYKDYLYSKKHLELLVIREVLTQQHLLEHSIKVNCLDSFKFLLKEFQVSYKEDLFENLQQTKRVFQILNTNGNIEILREVYNYYEDYYNELIMTQLETNLQQIINNQRGSKNSNVNNNWIFLNFLLNKYQCLKFNLKIIEKQIGINTIKEQFKLLNNFFAFAIKNNNLKMIKVILPYITLNNRDYNNYTPLELACKQYKKNPDLTIIEMLLNQENQNQTKINQNPQTNKCYITYMIKYKIPNKLINIALSLYTKEAIANYRNRENSNLLYLAIKFDNLDLIRTLLSYFGSKAFFERSINGVYPALEAKKSLNIEIKKMVNDYIQYKEVQEFMDEEWKIDPNVPEKLLLLKKQLFPSAAQSIEPYFFHGKSLIKPKRQKSLEKPKLQNFYEYTEHLEHKRMTEQEKKRKLLLHKNHTIRQSDLSLRDKKMYESISLGSELSKNGSILGKYGTKINFEKRNKIFHKSQYKLYLNQQCVYYNEDTFIEKYQNIQQIYQLVTESTHYVQQQYFPVLSTSQLFQGSNFIDNADIKFTYGSKHKVHERNLSLLSVKSPQNLRSFRSQNSNKKQGDTLQPQNKIMASIQFYINQMISKQNSQNDQYVDELSDFIIPIINSQTQQKVKYNEIQTNITLDVNKMTIAQKREYEQHQSQKKKVYQQLAKDYSNKLKIQQQSKKTLIKDQNDIDQMLNKSSDKNKERDSSNKHKRNKSKLSSNSLLENQEGKNQFKQNKLMIPQTQKNKQVEDTFSNQVKKEKSQFYQGLQLVRNISSPSTPYKQEALIDKHILNIPNTGHNTNGSASKERLSEASPKNNTNNKNSPKRNHIPSLSISTNKQVKQSNTQVQNQPKVQKQKSFLIKSQFQRQFSFQSQKSISISATPKANIKPKVKNSQTTLSKLINRTNTITPQAKQNVKLNLRAINRGKSYQDLLSPNGEDQTQNMISDLSELDQDTDQKNILSALVQNNSKQITHRSQDDQDLDQEQNDVVLQLNNINNDNDNYLELNKIDEVSEAASPYISPKYRGALKQMSSNVSSSDRSQDLTNLQAQQQQQNNMSFIKLIKTQDFDKLEQENQNDNTPIDGLNNDIHQDLERNQIQEKPKPYITPMPDNKNPLPQHHTKNVFSDQVINLQTQQDLNHFEQQAYDQINNQNQEVKNQNLNEVKTNKSKNFYQKYQLASSGSSVQLIDPKYQNVDEYKSMFSGMSNLDLRPQVKSYIKTKQNSQVKINNNNNHSNLPPHPQSRQYINNDNEQDHYTNQHFKFIPSKMLHNNSDFTYNKYRYKNEEEAFRIRKVVQNVNIIRHLKGSPLRLYPDLFQQPNQKICISTTSTPQLTSTKLLKHNNVSLFKTMKKSIQQERSLNSRNSIITQKEDFNNRKLAIIKKNVQTFKSGLMKGSTTKLVPLIIDQPQQYYAASTISPKQTFYDQFHTHQQLLYKQQSKASINTLQEQNYDYELYMPPNTKKSKDSIQTIQEVQQEDYKQKDIMQQQVQQPNNDDKQISPFHPQSKYLKLKKVSENTINSVVTGTFGDAINKQKYEFQIEELQSSGQSFRQHQTQQYTNKNTQDKQDKNNTHFYLYKNNQRQQSDKLNHYQNVTSDFKNTDKLKNIQLLSHQQSLGELSQTPQSYSLNILNSIQYQNQNQFSFQNQQQQLSSSDNQQQQQNSFQFSNNTLNVQTRLLRQGTQLQQLSPKNNSKNVSNSQNNSNSLVINEINNDKYEQLDNSHSKILDKLHAYPDMRTILKKEQSFYKKLKNSDINVPEQLQREIMRLNKQ